MVRYSWPTRHATITTITITTTEFLVAEACLKIDFLTIPCLYSQGRRKGYPNINVVETIWWLVIFSPQHLCLGLLFFVPANSIHRITENSISPALWCTRTFCYYYYCTPILSVFFERQLNK